MLAARNVEGNPVYMNVDWDEMNLDMKGFDTDQTSFFWIKKANHR